MHSLFGLFIFTPSWSNFLMLSNVFLYLCRELIGIQVGKSLPVALHTVLLKVLGVVLEVGLTWVIRVGPLIEIVSLRLDALFFIIFSDSPLLLLKPMLLSLCQLKVAILKGALIGPEPGVCGGKCGC